MEKEEEEEYFTVKKREWKAVHNEQCERGCR